MTNEFKKPPGLPTPVDWNKDRTAVRLLDQTLLPAEEIYLDLTTVDQMVEAIRSLRVRGAPAIGIAAAYGLALACRRAWETPDDGDAGLEEAFRKARSLLAGARPTAVNLVWALDRLSRVFEEAAPDGGEAQVVRLMAEAQAIAMEDRAMGLRIGEAGRELIPAEGCGVLTHCNAGALATGGIGTALAPVYAAHAAGTPVRLIADETRPLLQGARLTTWEARRVGVPVSLVTDSMAAAAMKAGTVNMVIVGADRVAANGDVANKIGTYGLAVLADYHGIPFYVALPTSTFDPDSPDGAAIPIEAREPGEVTSFSGTPTAPDGIGAWNPAFDVTPAHLVTAFITDQGLIRPPFEAGIAAALETATEEAP